MHTCQLLLLRKKRNDRSSPSRLHDRPADTPRFLSIGLSGVWNWTEGRVGKASDRNGVRRPVKGVIPDFDRINWNQRAVNIIFDANVTTNNSVEAARDNLAKELTRRGAEVSYVTIPTHENVNGIDDLLVQGPTRPGLMRLLKRRDRVRTCAKVASNDSR